MKKTLIALGAACCIGAVWADGDLSARMARAKSAAEDGVCSVTAMRVLDTKDIEGKNPLWMWAATGEAHSDSKDAFVRIEFELRPVPDSFIRCHLDLALPEKWDGRFWGQGNSGNAGHLPSVTGVFAREGMACVTTDMGTSRRPGIQATPPEMLKDFHWRATHLMTVYGKRLATAFYGEPPRHSYFDGGSTGGRQGMGEVLRYPEDYDGIVCQLPDNCAVVNELGMYRLYLLTHDAEGKALFTTNQMHIVSDAAVESRAKKDPKPYAGKALADFRMTEREIDAFLDIAAKKDPQLGEPDRRRRLKEMFLPACDPKGRCYFAGLAPGAYQGWNMGWIGICGLYQYVAGRKVIPMNARGYASLDPQVWMDYAAEQGPTFNASSDDLKAFRKRGGKILMTTGGEDQTISPTSVIDYYERVCRRDGGIDRTREYFRLFVFPGTAHGGVKGRICTCGPGGWASWRLLVDWVEKGVAPEKFTLSWPAEKTKIPVPAYPSIAVQDDAGNWRTVPSKRSKPLIAPYYLQTRVKGL